MNTIDTPGQWCDGCEDDEVFVCLLLHQEDLSVLQKDFPSARIVLEYVPMYGDGTPSIFPYIVVCKRSDWRNRNPLPDTWRNKKSL